MQVTIHWIALIWAKIKRAAAKCGPDTYDPDTHTYAGVEIGTFHPDNGVDVWLAEEASLSRALEFARAMEAEGLAVSVMLRFDPSEESHALLRLLNLQAIIA